MAPAERRAAFGLAAIFATRMLGLFLILPVFAVYARGLDGFSPALAGLAIGAYGLTQAALQIPFGWLSDRFGRKPVIAVGLLLFAAGSLLAAVGDSIWTVIAGRALQGTGAIAAAIMALAADLSRESQRSKVMAVIGGGIGVAFMAALMLGPALDSLIGVPGIFLLTACLAIAAIGLLFGFVPRPQAPAAPAAATRFRDVLLDAQLLRLDFGVFVLHMMLTAMFVVFPLVLVDRLQIPLIHHTWLYLGVMIAAIAVMVPVLISAERHQRTRLAFIGAVAVLAAANLLLAQGPRALWSVVVVLVPFFAAFNLLEATLPSLVSRLAPAARKGAALGVYSSSQFFGAFAGGTFGGWLHQHYGIDAVFLMLAGMAAVWAVVATGMRVPVRRAETVSGLSVADEFSRGGA